MKNHVRVNGQLLQTNKKWSQLKESQRSWIHEITREIHIAYVSEHGKLPMKKRKEDVLDAVHARIEERGIWIPYREFHSHVSVMIDKLNHKSPLFVPPVKNDLVEKPKTPKAPFEDFPAEVQGEIKSIIHKSVDAYIRQAHHVPSNQIRNGAIKVLLRRFNAKCWQPYGMQMQGSETLLVIYDEARDEVFTSLREAHVLPREISQFERNRLHAQTTVLETDRLILRKMTTKDIKEIRGMLSDPDVMHAWERVFTTRKEVTDWIVRQINRYENDCVGYFAAIDKVTGELIGQIGLIWNDIQGQRRLEVGYILMKSHWGKGYATEGAKACLSYGLSLFGLDKIYATIRPENAASIAVAERIGMKLECEYIKIYGKKPMKHFIYALKNPQYEC